MEGAKAVCLAVLMADAGWHGKVTGLSVESRIPSQVLRDVPESMLCRMRPDTLLIEKHTGDDIPFMIRNIHGIGGAAGFKLLRLHRSSICSEIQRKI